MLLSFRVANHRSIRDEQQLSLSPVYDSDRPEGTKWDAVPVAALFGANASGKSNVVNALRFMTRMVRASHRDAEPGEGLGRYPFLLDEESVEEPSWFVTDLLLDGVRHTYGFSVDGERVLDEWLYSYPKGRKRTLFQRSEDDFQFGDTMPRRELELVQSITEPNVLFLSVAARSRQDAVRPVYDWFHSAVLFRAGRAGSLHPTPAAVKLLSDPVQTPAVVELMRASDLGIEAVGVEKVHVADRRAAGRGRRRSDVMGGEAVGPDEGEGLLPGRPLYRIWVEHHGRQGPVRLGLREQSAGTQALLEYAAPVLGALQHGGLLVVDEIDSSLHPMLTAKVIGLFQDPRTNPHGAQLFLTTHDASLLGRSGGEDILKRDQVWFVEKDASGESTVFPLSDFRPRSEENRERRYLGGSYGAVPYLSDERFEAAIGARGGAGDGEDTET